jgi:hypothetical protein
MLIRKTLRTKAVLLVALGAVACGQNASVTRHQGTAAAPDASATAQPVVKGGEAEKLAEPSDEVPVATVSPVPSPNVPTPPVAAASPVPPPPQIFIVGPSGDKTPLPAPKDGQNGKDGKDGRDACSSNEFRQYVFTAQRLAPADVKVEELPLKATKQHVIKVKTLGGYTGTVQGQHYVKDDQVLFQLGVNLPPRDAVKKVSSAYLEMDLTKISKDGHPDTEFLCLIDEKVCSGGLYDEKTWQPNINPAFWSKTNNDLKEHGEFVSQFIKMEKVGRIAAGTIWGNETFQLKLTDLVVNSNFEGDVANLIYHDVSPTQRLARNFRVVVADDTYVRKAKLVVEVEENTCLSAQLSAAAASAAAAK